MLAVCCLEEKHLPSSSVATLSSLCLTSLRPSESDSSPCVSSSEEISSPEEKLALIWAKSIFLAILSKVDKKREMCLVYFMINNIIVSSILQQDKNVYKQKAIVSPVRDAAMPVSLATSVEFREPLDQPK